MDTFDVPIICLLAATYMSIIECRVTYVIRNFLSRVLVVVDILFITLFK